MIVKCFILGFVLQKSNLLAVFITHHTVHVDYSLVVTPVVNITTMVYT